MVFIFCDFQCNEAVEFIANGRRKHTREAKQGLNNPLCVIETEGVDS